MKYIKAGLERIILFTYQTLVILISKIVFKTQISSKQIIAILITYFGVMITFWGEIQFENESTILGGFLIFLSTIKYAS